MASSKFSVALFLGCMLGAFCSVASLYGPPSGMAAAAPAGSSPFGNLTVEHNTTAPPAIGAAFTSIFDTPVRVLTMTGYMLKFLALTVVGVFALALSLMLLAVTPTLANSSRARTDFCAAASHTHGFYASLWHYLVRSGAYPAPYFTDNTQARVQIFSLALVMRMWSQPHYRNGTFQEDMIKNLRNVALPGTGLPLSVLCASKTLCYVCLLAGYPFVALCAAFIREGRSSPKIMSAYSRQLLNPKDWFSFWRLNCRLATWHASVTGEKGYDLEDKWEFIQTAEANDIAISPCLKMPKLIVKHRNEEGGLGFHSFKNAAGMPNGEWLIQEHLQNDEFVSSMLPDDAPLSTFRVMSASRAGLPSARDNATATPERGSEEEIEHIEAMSCVFRAGRQGAVTDHVSILFDVDKVTGEIGRGTTNAHWYQLGASKCVSTPWTSRHDVTAHPDTGKTVTGTKVPDIKGMLTFVRRAHARMCPGVPVIGWDVALTTKGMLLLEANYSSNFFRGTFERPKYFKMVDDYFTFLDGAARSKAALKAE